MVYTLVLEAFVGPRPSGMQCRHLDGNVGNNHLYNLAWGTAKENATDREHHGNTRRGDSHARSILTGKQVEDIKERLANAETVTHLACKFGVSKSTISHIKTGRLWSHVN